MIEAELDTSLNVTGRTHFISLLAGFTAGLVNAAFARILMRIVALVMSGHGSFSIEGTANIFLFGVLAGTLIGEIYRLTVYKIRAPDLVKGLLLGLILVAVIQVPSLVIAPDFRAELMTVGPLGFAIFALMNFSFVLTLAFFVTRLEKAWPKRAFLTWGERLATIALGLLAFAGLALILVEMIGRPLGMIK